MKGIDHDQDTQQSRPAQFTGSEQWYRHALVRSVLFTDGAKHVADAGGAYWLLDEIALAQRYKKRVAAEEFQHWKLTVKDDHTARSLATTATATSFISKRIQFTDFPLEEIIFYFATTRSCCRASIDRRTGPLRRGGPPQRLLPHSRSRKMGIPA